VQDIVRDLGYTITFDWTGPEDEIRTDGSWDAASDRGAEIALREIQACRDADLIILLYPPNGGGLGCWIEVGAGLASGSEVYVVGAKRDSVFWQHPAVMRFDSVDDLAVQLELVRVG